MERAKVAFENGDFEQVVFYKGKYCRVAALFDLGIANRSPFWKP